MPITGTYKLRGISVGVVHFHGIVMIGAAGAIDTANTFTPGVVWTEDSTGIYECTYNDGVTVGFASLVATQIQTESLQLHLSVFPGELNAGTSSVRLTTSPLGGGPAVEPSAGTGWSYLLTRLNSSIAVS